VARGASNSTTIAPPAPIALPYGAAISTNALANSDSDSSSSGLSGSSIGKISRTWHAKEEERKRADRQKAVLEEEATRVQETAAAVEGQKRKEELKAKKAKAQLALLAQEKAGALRKNVEERQAIKAAAISIANRQKKELEEEANRAAILNANRQKKELEEEANRAAILIANRQKKELEEEANRVQEMAAAVEKQDKLKARKAKEQLALPAQEEATAVRINPEQREVVKATAIMTAERKKKGREQATAAVERAKKSQQDAQKAREVDEKFICKIHRHGSVDLELLQNLKAYLKPGASYELTTLLTSSHCHGCSKLVTEQMCSIYYCMRCKNEMCNIQNMADNEAALGDMRTLPWLCGPCYVAGLEHNDGRGQKSTRKRKPSSKAQK
jgi:hypothetical protein